MRGQTFLLAFGALGLVACSGGDNTQNDAGDGGVEAAVAYPAAHPAMPQIITKGGPVMAPVKIVPIAFTGDPALADIDKFASQLGSATDYWKGTTSEYGVGGLTVATPIHLNETPATNLADADIQAWLTNKIQTNSSFPQPDATTIYSVFYPDTVTVTMGVGETSCVQFQGYHDSYEITPGNRVIYAVIPRCPAPPVQGVTVIDQMTAEASHEFVEAATDPYPSSNPAYIQIDNNDLAWMLLGGGETGDICADFFLSGVFYRTPGVDSLVQRTWSNANAAASHDPCQPAGFMPYFNSAPVLPDMVHLSASGIVGVSQGIKLIGGASQTIELDLYSDGPTTGPWKVSAVDLGTFFGNPANLTFSFDKNTGQNGDKIQMTVNGSKSVPGGIPFWIQNDLGTQTTVWMAAVAPN